MNRENLDFQFTQAWLMKSVSETLWVTFAIVSTAKKQTKSRQFIYRQLLFDNIQYRSGHLAPEPLLKPTSKKMFSRKDTQELETIVFTENDSDVIEKQMY